MVDSECSRTCEGASLPPKCFLAQGCRRHRCSGCMQLPKYAQSYMGPPTVHETERGSVQKVTINNFLRSLTFSCLPWFTCTFFNIRHRFRSLFSFG